MKEEKIIYKYSNGFKQKVVGEIESGKYNREEARRVYGIGGASTINDWIKKMGKNELLGKVVKIESRNELDQINELKKEKDKLEKALGQAHLKILSLETLLEIVEEDTGKDYKKKAGLNK